MNMNDIDIPSTPEEIEIRMKELQKRYDEDMKNPEIFWPEMGLEYAGGAKHDSVEKL